MFFRDWRQFWLDVIKMWAKQHGINLALVWKLSPLAMAIGIIGIFAFPEPWRTPSWGILIGGALILLFSLCLVFPYRKWKKDLDIMNQSHTESLNALTEQINSLNPLRTLEEEQRGNEGEWLHLVVERIELGHRTNRPEREIVVGFQIDSGLAYDFHPYRMWVSPILGGWEPSEPQMEIRQPPNFLKGKRSQIDSKTVTIKDDKLWELACEARQGKDITKALKVEMQLEEGKSPVVLRSENFYSDRVNDARP